MKIVLIGSGNVAAVLGRKFRQAGHQISQVVSRNASAASALAYEWDTESTSYPSIIKKDADFYIIAVSDEAIAEVARELELPGKIVAHTAASVSKDVLQTVTEHYGVFYPLQSLHKEMNEPPEIPVFFDGADKITRTKLAALARSISPKHTTLAGDDYRIKLHLAAVVVNNFTNHLYALAENFCRQEGISFYELLPLIEETTRRIKETSPRLLQTGPAIRQDEETLRKHRILLEKYPELKKIYTLFSENIKNFHT